MVSLGLHATHLPTVWGTCVQPATLASATTPGAPDAAVGGGPLAAAAGWPDPGSLHPAVDARGCAPDAFAVRALAATAILLAAAALGLPLPAPPARASLRCAFAVLPLPSARRRRALLQVYLT